MRIIGLFIGLFTLNCHQEVVNTEPLSQSKLVCPANATSGSKIQLQVVENENKLPGNLYHWQILDGAIDSQVSGTGQLKLGSEEAITVSALSLMDSRYMTCTVAIN